MEDRGSREIFRDLNPTVKATALPRVSEREFFSRGRLEQKPVPLLTTDGN